MKISWPAGSVRVIASNTAKAFGHRMKRFSDLIATSMKPSSPVPIIFHSFNLIFIFSDFSSSCLPRFGIVISYWSSVHEQVTYFDVISYNSLSWFLPSFCFSFYCLHPLPRNGTFFGVWHTTSSRTIFIFMTINGRNHVERAQTITLQPTGIQKVWLLPPRFFFVLFLFSFTFFFSSLFYFVFMNIFF